MSEARTPRVDGFEIVAADISPVLGSRYRAWAGVARTLERESAALAAENVKLRKGLVTAVEMLGETKWVQHHCQCDVDSSLPIGAPGCPCTDWMTPLRSLLAAKGEGEE